MAGRSGAEAVRRYIVEIEDGYEPCLLNEQGEHLPANEAIPIVDGLRRTYPSIVSIYIGAGYPGSPRDDAYKIGISTDVERRARELNAKLVNWVDCDPRRYPVRKMESFLHDVCRICGNSLGGEWFELTHMTRQLLFGMRTPELIMEMMQIWEDKEGAETLAQELLGIKSHLIVWRLLSRDRERCPR